MQKKKKKKSLNTVGIKIKKNTVPSKAKNVRGPVNFISSKLNSRLAVTLLLVTRHRTIV